MLQKDVVGETSMEVKELSAVGIYHFQTQP
jgi:hypothetical protein